MVKLRRIRRLFEVKTRFEAWLVTYAIALGAVERGRHYMDSYPGWGGWLLALACTGVVFVAGAKQLDSVKAPLPILEPGPYRAPVQRHSAVMHGRRTRVPTIGHASSRYSRRGR